MKVRCNALWTSWKRRTITVYKRPLSNSYDTLCFIFLCVQIGTPGLPVPWDIYTLYMAQFGFYVHSVYGTLYMDHWRKDSYVMLFHHLLTTTLLAFSYIARYFHDFSPWMFTKYLHINVEVCVLSETMCVCVCMSSLWKQQDVFGHHGAAACSFIFPHPQFKWC